MNGLNRFWSARGSARVPSTQSLRQDVENKTDRKRYSTILDVMADTHDASLVASFKSALPIYVAIWTLPMLCAVLDDHVNDHVNGVTRFSENFWQACTTIYGRVLEYEDGWSSLDSSCRVKCKQIEMNGLIFNLQTKCCNE